MHRPVGASGVGIAGSPAQVLVRNTGEHALDIQAIQFGSLLRPGSKQTQADFTRWQGGWSRTASFFNAASDVIRSATTLYDPARSIRFAPSVFAA